MLYLFHVVLNNYPITIYNIKLRIQCQFKDRLQSLLRIGSAHNKCGPHCPNFALVYIPLGAYQTQKVSDIQLVQSNFTDIAA